jgi:hypothetical protein
VEVYLETLHAEGDTSVSTVNGVRYFSVSDFDAADPPDVFIAWRYAVSLGVLSSGIERRVGKPPLRLLWLHDLLPDGVLPTDSHMLKKYVRIIG